MAWTFCDSANLKYRKNIYNYKIYSSIQIIVRLAPIPEVESKQTSKQTVCVSNIQQLPLWYCGSWGPWF